MSDYVPYVGRLDNGDEVLVTIQAEPFFDERDTDVELVVSVEVAFRPVGARTWGPPVALVRAP